MPIEILGPIAPPNPSAGNVVILRPYVPANSGMEAARPYYTSPSAPQEQMDIAARQAPTEPLPLPRPYVEQRAFPSDVTTDLQDPTSRLAAMGRFIDADARSQARFAAGRQSEIEAAQRRRAEWREQRVESLATAGAVAVGGLRRAARWMRTRHVAAKRAVKNAAQATAAYIS